MKPLLIISHVAHEGPGYLQTVLQHRGIPFHSVSIDHGDPLPEHMADYSGLVSMGGPMSVNDALPWIEQELQLIRQAIHSALPVLGHCLGGQLISKALGGNITRNVVPEIGWYDIEQVESLVRSDWLEELPPHFLAFHWHGETFSIPSGATLLLRNTHCAHQGFVIGNTLALQCHIEMTAPMVRDWVARAPEDFTPLRTAVQPAIDVLADLETHVSKLQSVANKIYDRWLRGIRK